MTKAYVWCPAYPLADEAALVLCRRQLHDLCGRLAWQVVEGDSLSVRLPQGSWATAEMRRAELPTALSHPVLIAGRGGYGCIELAEELLAFPGTPGLLIGYSDLTVFHAIWRVRGWGETLYGFLPGVAGGKRSIDSTAVLAKGQGLMCNNASDPLVHALYPGHARGPGFAGCLRVLTSLIGTPAMPDLNGTILCLEDTDERPYQMDRDLQQLHHAGALTGIVGLVFGIFPARVAPGYAGPSSRDIAARWAKRLKIPAIAGLPFGHDPDPLTLPCGRAVELKTEARDWSLVVHAR